MYSVVLQEPLFVDVTIREGETLKVTCITRNIQDITTSQIFDPRGVVVPSAVGVFTVENATRDASGVYTCLVTSTINNSTINATSTVVIQCKLSSSGLLEYCSSTPLINFSRPFTELWQVASKFGRGRHMCTCMP